MNFGPPTDGSIRRGDLSDLGSHSCLVPRLVASLPCGGPQWTVRFDSALMSNRVEPRPSLRIIIRRICQRLVSQAHPGTRSSQTVASSILSELRHPSDAEFAYHRTGSGAQWAQCPKSAPGALYLFGHLSSPITFCKKQRGYWVASKRP